MDETRFDNLARWLGRAQPRRRLLARAAGLLAGAALLSRPSPTRADAGNCCGTPTACCGDGWICLADPDGTFRGCCQGTPCADPTGHITGCCYGGQVCRAADGACVPPCPSGTVPCGTGCVSPCPPYAELAADTCTCECTTVCGGGCKGDPSVVCCKEGTAGFSCPAGQTCCGSGSCCSGKQRCARGKCVKKKRKK
jgi:hypothetical protein